MSEQLKIEAAVKFMCFEKYIRAVLTGLLLLFGIRFAAYSQATEIIDGVTHAANAVSTLDQQKLLALVCVCLVVAVCALSRFREKAQMTMALNISKMQEDLAVMARRACPLLKEDKDQK